MLRNLSALEGMSIQALDGEIGNVTDTYFDDYTWTVRYLAVDTSMWLPGGSSRRAGMAPAARQHG